MALNQKLKLKNIIADQGAKIGLLAVLLKIIIIQTMLGWDKFLQIPGYGLINFIMFVILGILVGSYIPKPLNYAKAFLIGFIATLIYNLSAAYLFKAVAIITVTYEIMYGIETGILAIAIYYILYRRKK